VQKIYTEWFVKSSNKNISKEWQVKKLPEVIEINPRISKEGQSLFPQVGMDILSTNSMLIEASEIELGTKTAGSKFQNGDTLFARITPCLENGKTGYVQFLDENEIGVGSTEFIVLRGKTVPNEFVYCLARNEDFREKAKVTMVGASGRQRVANDFFKEYSLLVPPADLLNKFEKIAKPAFAEIGVLAKQNKELKKMRSILIPQLVGGKVLLK
jgi:type I restriction enzyme S subunit